MEENGKGIKNNENSKITNTNNKEKTIRQKNTDHFVTSNKKIFTNNKQQIKLESQKNISNILSKQSNNLYSFRKNSKIFQNNKPDINNTNKNLNKNASNQNNTKIFPISSVNRKNTLNKLKYSRKNSGIMINKKI